MHSTGMHSAWLHSIGRQGIRSHSKDPRSTPWPLSWPPRRSTRVNDAVQQVLRVELERSEPDSASQEAEARTAAVLELLQCFQGWSFLAMVQSQPGRSMDRR